MTSSAERALRSIAKELDTLGANLTIEGPQGERVQCGRRPDAARVVFRDTSAIAALERREHLALAEAFLRTGIDVEGDWLEVMRVTEIIRPDPRWWERLSLGAKLLLRSRRRLQRNSIAFHYDRPPEFFLPWLDRWRSYSHGFYASPNEGVTLAQERKLDWAIAALGVKPGDLVFDMGCGWGAFLEYAGRLGIRVHGITISREQYRFVRSLIERERLPCEVEFVDFLDYAPRERFAGAVFMGTFEHFTDYPAAIRFLDAHLADDGRVYADFCSDQSAHQAGAFLARYIWPGTATYVDLPRLLRAFQDEGFHLHALQDDTQSYALTVRDWADSFDAQRAELNARFGEEPVRAFHLFLHASQYFLGEGRTQAYHLVAGRQSAGLSAPG